MAGLLCEQESGMQTGNYLFFAKTEVPVNGKRTAAITPPVLPSFCFHGFSESEYAGRITSDTVIASCSRIRIQERNMAEDRIETRLHERVDTVMTPCPLSISADIPRSQVLELFSRQNDKPVLVTESDGSLAGVITPLDIIAALIPAAGSGGRHRISELDRYLKSTAQNARDLISDEPVTLKKNATIGEALQMMEQSHSTTIIVVNEDGTAAGCVTLAQVIASLTRSQ
jgi:CBS-domain-containing membrane protein